MFILLAKCWPIGMFRPKPLLKTTTTTSTTANYYYKPLLNFFKGHTDNDKCNTWGLETSSIPRRDKVQHMKEIANVLADSVSRLKAVSLYHDIDFKDHQQEFSTPVDPLPPVEPVNHMQLEVNEFLLHQTLRDSHKLMKHYTTHPLQGLMMMSNYHFKTSHPWTSHNWNRN